MALKPTAAHRSPLSGALGYMSVNDGDLDAEFQSIIAGDELFGDLVGDPGAPSEPGETFRFVDENGDVFIDENGDIFVQENT